MNTKDITARLNKLSGEITDIAKEIAKNYEEITGTPVYQIYDPEGSFDQDIIDKDWPAIQQYLENNYPDYVDNEDLLYEIDEELMLLYK